MIGDSIEALSAALVAAGVAAPQSPSDDHALTQLEQAIAPLALPTDVRRFWERVDVRKLQMSVFPRFIDPGFALESWERERDWIWDGTTPLALLMVGYESHNCMSVELDTPGVPGGAMFEWRVDSRGFWRCFNGLHEWLDEIALLLTSGAFQHVQLEGYSPWLAVEVDDTRLGSRPVAHHPFFGNQIEFTGEPLRWPAHWQRATGIDPDSIAPRGSTDTIAELLAADPATTPRATIAGEVYQSSARQLWVRDDSGEMVVERPDSVRYMPSTGHRYEFDVVRGVKPRKLSGDGVDAWLGPADDDWHTDPTAVRPLAES